MVKNKIGFLPEESYLYKFLNAEEILDFYARLFHIPRVERKRRIDKLIGDVGLQPYRKRPLSQYSKGMQRRIGLAQAIINDPELVILDEPTSGLDPMGVVKSRSLSSDLKSRERPSFSRRTCWQTCKRFATGSPSSTRAFYK